jgi:Chalcone isomerase-like
MQARIATAARRPVLLFFLALASALSALALFSPRAFALDPSADGWFHTGDGIRVKHILVDFNVYAIGHDMKALPDTKSKQAVIDLDVDKRFTWRMLRDVEHEKIQKALQEAFAMNGYTDGSKTGPFIGAFSGDLTKGQTVTIAYNSAAKTVSVSVQGGGSATLSGVDFMKGVWSIWLGKIDQPGLGDALIRNL